MNVLQNSTQKLDHLVNYFKPYEFILILFGNKGMSKTKEFCDFGSNYGTCSTKDKNGNPMDTTKIRAVAYEVKVDGETYFTCKGCVTHFPFTAKNQDETSIYEVKTGADVTCMFDTESIN